jgi:hypothetical protein
LAKLEKGKAVMTDPHTNPDPGHTAEALGKDEAPSVKPQTGPKTASGKARSALNALKGGAYVERVLDINEREFFTQLQAAMEEDLSECGVTDDAIATMANQTLAMAQLRSQRLAAIEATQLRTWMQSSAPRQELAKAMGLYITQAQDLPDWLFAPNHCEEKKLALSRARAIAQAERLEATYSEEALEHVHFSHPDLYGAVMALAPRTKASFSRVLTAAFREDDPKRCLSLFCKWIVQKYPWSMRWATDAERLGMIVDHLRSQAQLAIMSHEGRLKLNGQLHKQSMQSLAILQTLRTQARAAEKTNAMPLHEDALIVTQVNTQAASEKATG